jgi:hypothetical protein
MIIKYYDLSNPEEQTIDSAEHMVFGALGELAFLRGIVATKCIITDIR